MQRWTKRTELPAAWLLRWLELQPSKFHQWQKRYGRVNAHNGQIPRDWWLADWERVAILHFHDRHPLEGYRRLTFMMLDDDVVAISPSSVYRVLKHAGRLDRKWQKPSKKGSGFVQPLQPHDHWHVDVSYINLAGTFYFLFTVLDGYSRFIVHWEIRETMKEPEVETIVQRALRDVSRRQTANHQRQWPAVHRPRFQRVHPPDRHHARADESLLSAVQRQAGTLAQER